MGLVFWLTCRRADAEKVDNNLREALQNVAPFKFRKTAEINAVLWAIQNLSAPPRFAFGQVYPEHPLRRQSKGANQLFTAAQP
jgi:hypothetical protein